MSTVTENDLKEVKQLINDFAKTQQEQFEKLNEKIDSRYQSLDSKINDIRVDIATLKEGQKSLDKRLDDVQSSINKRLDDTQSNVIDDSHH